MVTVLIIVILQAVENPTHAEIRDVIVSAGLTLGVEVSYTAINLLGPTIRCRLLQFWYAGTRPRS